MALAQSNMYPSAAHGEPASTRQSITDKSHNLMILARQVRQLASQCSGKVLPPTPDSAAVPSPPDPDHMVFMLEAAEDALRNASTTLDVLLSNL